MTRVTAEAEESASTLKTEIGEARTEIETLLTQGDTLANESDWTGVDADNWRDHWTDEVRPTLSNLGEQLETVAETTSSILDNIFRAGGRV